jgi:hypothetical protein
MLTSTQAPKPPSATKTASLLHHIRASSTAHTLKELEKSAPGPTGISSMQLKDHLQALVDENMIRVEKIGSGNWYWSFMSEESRVRKEALAKLKLEKETTEAKVENLREQARAAEVTEDERWQREESLGTVQTLRLEVESMVGEVESYEGNDPLAMEEMKRASGKAKESAERWTDNILMLEAWFLELTGGDREALDGVRRTVYGGEYIEGEGLVEL